MSSPERMKEVIDICLKTFMEKGLAHTSTRDLCAALDLQPGGVFFYFKSKDDIIIACAEEAKRRIEINLLGSALDNIDKPHKLYDDLYNKADEMKPLMQFFVTVCVLPKYQERIIPVLENLSERYKYYTLKFAEKLGCTFDEVAPYVYIVINTLLSYMLFGQDKGFFAPQVPLVRTALVRFLDKENMNVRETEK